MNRVCIGLAATFALCPVVFAAADETVHFTLLGKGAGKRIGYYGPQKVELSAEKPATITKLPEGLTAPLFTQINTKGWGDEKAVYHVVLDEPEGKAGEPEPGSFRMWVDANGNGDLTDDPKVEWKGKYGKTEDELTFMTYQGIAMINLGNELAKPSKPYLAGVRFYRFDKTDARRTNTVNSIMYYRDYATEGELTLSGKKYHAMLVDEGCRGSFLGMTGEEGKPLAHSGVSLIIDVNGNGRTDNKGESFDSHKPFNIGGTTYELADIARDGLSFRLVKSSQTVEEIPTPPDHTPGKRITPFDATMMDGRPIHFPGDYKGKVVMLDFWATWCGPCMAEMPHVIEAYNKFHADGFEVLGITLDNKDMTDKINKVMGEKGMVWPQIYQGLGWQDTIAQTYVVQGIPAAYLVDGDTGLVLAEGGDLRDPKMLPSIENAMTSRARRLGKIRDAWVPVMGGD